MNDLKTKKQDISNLKSSLPTDIKLDFSYNASLFKNTLDSPLYYEPNFEDKVIALHIYFLQKDFVFYLQDSIKNLKELDHWIKILKTKQNDKKFIIDFFILLITLKQNNLHYFKNLNELSLIINANKKIKNNNLNNLENVPLDVFLYLKWNENLHLYYNDLETFKQNIDPFKNDTNKPSVFSVITYFYSIKYSSLKLHMTYFDTSNYIQKQYIKNLKDVQKLQEETSNLDEVSLKFMRDRIIRKVAHFDINSYLAKSKTFDENNTNAEEKVAVAYWKYQDVWGD